MAKKKSKVGGARPGAGRPRSEDPPVVVSASVPTSLAKRLDAWAAKRKTTRAKAVREAVERLLGS